MSDLQEERKVPEHDTEADFVKALQLQEQEEQMVKMSEEQDLGTPSCGICLMDIGLDDLSDMPCTHIFCRGCLHHYLKGRIEEKQLPIHCPSDGCEIEMSEPHIRANIDDIRLLEKY